MPSLALPGSCVPTAVQFPQVWASAPGRNVSEAGGECSPTFRWDRSHVGFREPCASTLAAVIKVVSVGISLPLAIGTCLVKVCNSPKGQLTTCSWAAGMACSLQQRPALGTGRQSRGAPSSSGACCHPEALFAFPTAHTPALRM